MWYFAGKGHERSRRCFLVSFDDYLLISPAEENDRTLYDGRIAPILQSLSVCGFYLLSFVVERFKCDQMNCKPWHDTVFQAVSSKSSSCYTAIKLLKLIRINVIHFLSCSQEKHPSCRGVLPPGSIPTFTVKWNSLFWLLWRSPWFPLTSWICAGTPQDFIAPEVKMFCFFKFPIFWNSLHLVLLQNTTSPNATSHSEVNKFVRNFQGKTETYPLHLLCVLHFGQHDGRWENVSLQDDLQVSFS